MGFRQTACNCKSSSEQTMYFQSKRWNWHRVHISIQKGEISKCTGLSHVNEDKNSKKQQTHTLPSPASSTHLLWECLWICWLDSFCLLSVSFHDEHGMISKYISEVLTANHSFSELQSTGAFCWNSNPDYGFTSQRSLPGEQRDVKSVVFRASEYAECTLGSSAAIIYPGIVVDLWLLGLHKRFLRHCWSFLLTAQMIGKCFC